MSFEYTALHQVDAIYSTGANTFDDRVLVTDYHYEYEDDDEDRRSLLTGQTLNSALPIELELEFDEMGRTLSRIYKQDDWALVGFEHEYNLTGQRLKDDHVHNPSDSESYAYDSALRLQGVERPSGFAQSWSLDELGNWTQFNNNGETQHREHNAVNEVTSTGSGEDLVYDDNGNLIFHDGKEYVWDANNRLKSVYSTTIPGAVARYSYSAMNQRVLSDVDSDGDGLLDEQTVYIYCHQKVCEEQDPQGNFKRDFVHGGQFVDEVVMTSSSPGGLGDFSLTDLRYSVYAVVSRDGEVLERYRYDPYGDRTVMHAGFGVLAESEIGQEFGYTGRRHDAGGTGLMYFRARYYSAELGRFVSRDPLGFVDGMSMYRGYFVVNGVDPSGNEEEKRFELLEPDNWELTGDERPLGDWFPVSAKKIDTDGNVNNSAEDACCSHITVDWERYIEAEQEGYQRIREWWEERFHGYSLFSKTTGAALGSLVGGYFSKNKAGIAAAAAAGAFVGDLVESSLSDTGWSEIELTSKIYDTDTRLTRWVQLGGENFQPAVDKKSTQESCSWRP